MSVLADQPKNFSEVSAEPAESKLGNGVDVWSGQYFNDFFVILVVRLSDSQNLSFVFNKFCKCLLQQPYLHSTNVP
jgi:hypothetical protein